MTEEITGFDRPRHRTEHRVRAARRPRGPVDCTETPAGTAVTWTAVFGFRSPAPGRGLDPILGVAFGSAFRLVLRDVERRVHVSREER